MGSMKSDDFAVVVKKTGIDLADEDGVIVWKGPYGGQNKPRGPLSGKRVGVIVASEFSDFQAYYLVSYIGEFGGVCEFLLVDWVKWKMVRPNIPQKGVRGMWDLSVDPVPVIGGDKASRYKGLRDAQPHDYDALIIVGGHSADVMVTESEVIQFIKSAAERGAVIGGIGSGIMPLISAGLVHGKHCTGDRTVDYMLRKIARYEAAPVLVDGKLITARATVDTPKFLRSLCTIFDPKFSEPRKGLLVGRKVMFLVGEDFEDIELVVPTMELLYRGADIIIGTFKPEMKSRPALLGLDVMSGNFGVSIPFQEIPESYYSIKRLEEIKMSDFDVVIITGAFNPWNVVATGTAEWLPEPWAAGKIIAAICHGAIPVAAADLVQGRKLTGWSASRDSVEIMGGFFRNEEWSAAIDGRLVTGRTPPEIPEFIDAVTMALLLD